MNITEALKLDSGFKVFWEDPDEGKCSRYYTISKIEIKGTILCITDIDGSYIECFAHELS